MSQIEPLETVQIAQIEPCYYFPIDKAVQIVVQ